MSTGIPFYIKFLYRLGFLVFTGKGKGQSKSRSNRQNAEEDDDGSDLEQVGDTSVSVPRSLFDTVSDEMDHPDP